MTFHFVPILWLLSLISSTSAKCQSFQPQYFRDHTIDYAFTATQRSFVASAVVNCSTAPDQTPPGVFFGNETSDCASNQCQLTTPADYYIRLNRTLSISVDSASEKDIFDLVEPHFGAALRTTDLNMTGIWPVSQVSTCINESISAYWAYNPIYSCIEGNLTECGQGSYPSDGTFIRACGIKILSSGNRFAGGELSVVQGSGYGNEPAPPNATENAAIRIWSTGLYAELGMVVPFIVALITCLNLDI